MKIMSLGRPTVLEGTNQFSGIISEDTPWEVSYVKQAVLGHEWYFLLP